MTKTKHPCADRGRLFGRRRGPGLHGSGAPGLGALGLALATTAIPLGALAQQAPPATAPPAADSSAPPAGANVSEVVVNGVPYRETVLPTRLSSDSAYGINLGVMDTPRNTTLLSTTQLETLNIDDPRAFSYLTSSSYTDSAFGTPNIPRVRTQYADLYYNGMRDSLTQNGYGVPVNFDAVANISITKGPANVVDGPGPGVGGEVDFLTKRPDMNHPTGAVSATFDTVGDRRWVVDAGAPIVPGDLAMLLSYSGEDSSSYFYGHYMRKNALYGALKWVPNDNYTLNFNSEINVEQYTEDVGVNRANQALINSGQYLTGSVPPPGEPAGYLTEWFTDGAVKLNPRVTIDQTPGTSSRGWLYNAQIIQSYRLNDNLTLENNSLFMFQNSDNQEAYYYADNSNGSYTVESKSDLKGDFLLNFGNTSIRNQFVAGFTIRYAYTNYISNFNNEAVSVWDLSGNPNSWRLDPAQQTYGDAVLYTSVFGRLQYGVLGRDSVSGGNTGASGLWDSGIFYQDRMEFSPKFSLLFGARIDALQDHTSDLLDCSPEGYYTCEDYLPASHTTGVYGLGNANFSAVYKFSPQISTYATVDWVQSPPNPNGGEGGINAYGMVPDSKLLRGNSFLYEAGLKLNLFDNKLFVSTAVFDQTHQVPTGPADTLSEGANTRGVELEANYQPNRNLFATASYSFIKTTLDSPPPFYDFPAQPGENIDGEGSLVTFLPNQKVDQPDQPQHLFNFLGNYKFSNGIGLRTGVQVTGPIPLTSSAWIDTGALLSTLSADYLDPVIPNSVKVSASNPNIGYYTSPVIPWQYTWNAAVFYEYKQYTITLSVYNLTDQHNWQPSPSYYGNDFLVLSNPRTFEIRLQAKF